MKKARVRKPVVAVVNTNDDLVSALQHALEADGFNIVTAHIEGIKSGTVNFAAFLDEHDPAVVIYDIALPYDANWTFLNMLRQLPQAQQRPFVVTTVNKRALDVRVGPNDAIEIQGGHAQDVAPTMDAVRKVLRVNRSVEPPPSRGARSTDPIKHAARARTRRTTRASRKHR
jgi:CheY-like chemotaxis protein